MKQFLLFRLLVFIFDILKGQLDGDKIKRVIKAMVELLNVKVKPNEVDKLTQECIQELTKDGKITKSNFFKTLVGYVNHWFMRSM